MLVVEVVVAVAVVESHSRSGCLIILYSRLKKKNHTSTVVVSFGGRSGLIAPGNEQKNTSNIKRMR